MKITALHFGMPNYDLLLDAALFVVTETLRELDEIDIETERIAFLNIPFYDGMSSKTIENIAQTIASSDGIIVATPVSIGAPNALCKAFFENISDTKYRTAISAKNCFILVVSKENGGERQTVNAVADMLVLLDCYDAVRLSIDAETAALINSDEKIRETIEKHAEDFYRILRQKRSFFLSNATTQTIKKTLSHTSANKTITANNTGFDVTPEEYEMLLTKEKQKQTAAELLDRRKAEKTYEQDQDRNIQEITQFFVEKYTKADFIGQSPALRSSDTDVSSFSPQYGSISPRAKTVKQMTFALPHFFKPQLAAGLNAILQINISGEESFNCYISISNTECEIYEGNSEKSDIIIISEAKVWSEVLKGKHTAQKAFMIGQLKVRGNFMLLTKFDQLFTLEMN